MPRPSSSGFAASTAGEYAGNIFWVVGFSLIISWIVAVTFTPYLGVKLLPNIKKVEGGHAAIYATRNYQRLRRELLDAERGALYVLRNQGRISEDVMNRVQRDLDLGADFARLVRDQELRGRGTNDDRHAENLGRHPFQRALKRRGTIENRDMLFGKVFS